MSKVEEFWQDVADAIDCTDCPFGGRCLICSDDGIETCSAMIQLVYIMAAVEDRQTAREESDAPV